MDNNFNQDVNVVQNTELTNVVTPAPVAEEPNKKKKGSLLIIIIILLLVAILLFVCKFFLDDKPNDKIYGKTTTTVINKNEG